VIVIGVSRKFSMLIGQTLIVAVLKKWESKELGLRTTVRNSYVSQIISAALS
jgi:hypothetical protein